MSSTPKVSEAGLIPTPDDDFGILLWDKPAGVTSHDVVEEIRRETGMKAGHAGTLDPFATGLLVVLLGRATRLQRFLVGLPKRYLATAKLGWTSSTGDPDGDLRETGVIPGDLEIATGRSSQKVPMTSAARVGGERLYRKAHRGEVTPDRPVREISVLESRLVDTELDREGRPTVARYVLTVSSGTYIRNIVSDLGDAYCLELRREAVGDMEVMRSGSLLNPLEALAFMPVVQLSPDDVLTVSHGRPLSRPAGLDGIADGDHVRLAAGDLLVGVGRVREGAIRPEVVLRPSSG